MTEEKIKEYFYKSKKQREKEIGYIKFNMDKDRYNTTHTINMKLIGVNHSLVNSKDEYFGTGEKMFFRDILNYFNKSKDYIRLIYPDRERTVIYFNKNIMKYLKIYISDFRFDYKYEVSIEDNLGYILDEFILDQKDFNEFLRKFESEKIEIGNAIFKLEETAENQIAWIKNKIKGKKEELEELERRLDKAETFKSDVDGIHLELKNAVGWSFFENEQLKFLVGEKDD